MAFLKKKKREDDSANPESNEIFLAVLSGLVAREGATNTEGVPALELIDRAMDFSNRVKERIQ